MSIFTFNPAWRPSIVKGHGLYNFDFSLYKKKGGIFIGGLRVGNCLQKKLITILNKRNLKI